MASTPRHQLLIGNGPSAGASGGSEELGRAALTPADDPILREVPHQSEDTASQAVSQFAFVDSKAGLSGVVDVDARPTVGHAAVRVGLWQGAQGLHLSSETDVAITGGANTGIFGRLVLECVTPNELWRIDYEDGATSASLTSEAIGPVVEWESQSIKGRRYYEQPTRFRGNVRVGADQWEINALGHRVRSWGLVDCQGAQQAWSAWLNIDDRNYFHVSLITVNGRDMLFGYACKDGNLAPVSAVDVAIAHGYPGGPAVLSQVRLMDEQNRLFRFVVEPMTVVSTVLATSKVDVVEHTALSHFASDWGVGAGWLRQVVTDPLLARTHIAAHEDNATHVRTFLTDAGRGL